MRRSGTEEPEATAGNAAALAVATLLLVAALAGTGLGFIILGLECDNSCLDPGVNGAWSATDGAWQWKAQFGLTLVGLVLTIVAIHKVDRCHYNTAIALWTSAAILYGAWALLLHENTIGGF